MRFFAYLTKAMNLVTTQYNLSCYKKPSQNVQWLRHNRSLFLTSVKSKTGAPAQQAALL